MILVHSDILENALIFLYIIAISTSVVYSRRDNNDDDKSNNNIDKNRRLISTTQYFCPQMRSQMMMFQKGLAVTDEQKRIKSLIIKALVVSFPLSGYRPILHCASSWIYTLLTFLPGEPVYIMRSERNSNSSTPKLSACEGRLWTIRCLNEGY